MRKLYIIFALLLAVCSMSAQGISRNGNTFKVIRDTLVTEYKYEDSKGKIYPIVVNRQTGACYVCKVSKNGKFYRQNMAKDIKLAICKELNIKIKED